MSAAWSKGRGLLGPLKPLLGRWDTAGSPDATGAGRMRCTREFTAFGKDWVKLEAAWEMGPDKTYREIALFGRGEGGALACFSFTNDGKRSQGRLADGADVHPQAVAFEAQMPAGRARMIYWPAEDGFSFAVEGRTQKGWNRFLEQRFRPVGG